MLLDFPVHTRFHPVALAYSFSASAAANSMRYALMKPSIFPSMTASTSEV